MHREQRPILLFDGVCNLCNGTVRFILKHDRKDAFRFAALQSDAGRAQLARLGLDAEALPSVILVEGDGYSQRSTAALGVLAALGWPYRALGLLLLIPRPLRDWGYDFIARHRYRWFGRRRECMLPTPEMRMRFLE